VSYACASYGMWILDGPLHGDAEAAVDFVEEGGQTSLWAEELANQEAQRLSSAGLQALPLKVRNCGPLGMYHVGKTPQELQRFAFNRVTVATNFDFANVQSMEVGSMDEDSWSSPDGKMYFCVICLLRVCHGTKKAARFCGREMVMVFPYVFEDPRNPLTHWALVNGKQQARYIVRRNVRPGSFIVPGQKLLSSAEESEIPCATATDGDHESHHDGLQHNVSTRNRTRLERIHLEWLKLSVKQREEMLSFEDPAIFERTLNNVFALFSTTCIGVEIATKFRGLPLLSSIEFEKTCAGPKLIKISGNILQDGTAFFATLRQLCPRLFSGKLRHRSNPAGWSALFETHAQEAWELQQRIAELIEQKLWALGETPACGQQGSFGGKPLTSSQSGHGRRRARNKKKKAACVDNSRQALAKESSWLAATPEDMVAHAGDESIDGDSPAGTSGTDSHVGINMCQRQQDACCDALDVIESGRLPEHESPGSSTEQASSESTEAEQFRDFHIPQLYELQGFKEPAGLELPESARAQLILRNQLLQQQLEVAGNKVSISQLIAERMLGA